jgi:hypothetical protein
MSDYRAYRALSHANVKSSAACLRGVIRACRSLFAIEPGNDTSGSWLDAEERRSTVTRFGPSYLRGRTVNGVSAAPAWDRCVRAGIDSACRDALRAIGYQSPLQSQVRAELMRLALTRGGAEAFARMRGERGDDIGRTLETTAGVPLDTLLGEWRARVIAARPESPKPNSRELAVSALLVVCAVAASAGRRP